MQFSLISYHFIFLRFKYCSQHPVLKRSSLRYSHNVRNQASYPYKTTGKIMVLYITIFTYLDSRWEDKRTLCCTLSKETSIRKKYCICNKWGKTRNLERHCRPIQIQIFNCCYIFNIFFIFYGPPENLSCCMYSKENLSHDGETETSVSAAARVKKDLLVWRNRIGHAVIYSNMTRDYAAVGDFILNRYYTYVCRSFRLNPQLLIELLYIHLFIFCLYTLITYIGEPG
jgi:hypothetical protein